MAFELLSQVNPDRKNVSSISIVPGGKGWRGGAEVSELVVSEGRGPVSLYSSCPFPPLGRADGALEERRKMNLNRALRSAFK